MTQIELNKFLEEHKKWLETEGKEGKRAKLSGEDLRQVDLSCANLRYADFSLADLRHANLSDADLRYADVNFADLSFANLSNADLRYAVLDYSTFPLWSGGLNVHIDDRQATQLLYHLVRNVLFSKNTSKELKNLLGSKELIEQANKFHRVKKFGKIGGEDA